MTLVVWNGMAAHVPPIALRPASVGELADAIRYAREHGLLVEVADPSRPLSERAVTLDLSLLGPVSGSE